MHPGRLALFLGSCLWAQSGVAQPLGPRAVLRVERGLGAESCVGAKDLEHAVELRLSRPVFDTGGAVNLQVSVTFARRDRRGYQALVVLADERGAELGRREIETSAPHCSSLDDSLALIVALLVESPEAQAHASSTPAAPPHPTEAKPAPAQPSTAPPGRLVIPADTLARREPFRVDVAAAAAAVVGELPGVAPGVALVLGIRPPHFIELRLRPSWLPGSEALGSPPGRGAHFSLLEVALTACPLEQELGSVRFSGCVGQSIGRVRARAFGFARSQRADALVFGLGAEAGVFWKLAPPVAALLGLAIFAPVERNAYVARTVDGSERSLFRASPVTATALGGIGVEL
jgi:hypothetical protein